MPGDFGLVNEEEDGYYRPLFFDRNTISAF